MEGDGLSFLLGFVAGGATVHLIWFVYSPRVSKPSPIRWKRVLHLVSMPFQLWGAALFIGYCLVLLVMLSLFLVQRAPSVWEALTVAWEALV